MPDELIPEAGQVPTSEPGQMPTEPIQPVAEEPGAPQADSSTQAVDAREKQIADLRKENAARRKAVADLEAKIKAFEERDLSEAEKRDNRLKELESHNRTLSEENRRVKVESVATRLGCIDPELVASFLKVEEGQTEEQAITALLEAKPYLKTAAPATPPAAPQAPRISPTNPARTSSASPLTIRRSQLDDMQFCVDHQEEISRAYAEGRIIDG